MTFEEFAIGFCLICAMWACSLVAVGVTYVVYKLWTD